MLNILKSILFSDYKTPEDFANFADEHHLWLNFFTVNPMFISHQKMAKIENRIPYKAILKVAHLGGDIELLKERLFRNGKAGELVELVVKYPQYIDDLLLKFWDHYDLTPQMWVEIIELEIPETSKTLLGARLSECDNMILYRIVMLRPDFLPFIEEHTDFRLTPKDLADIAKVNANILSVPAILNVIKNFKIKDWIYAISAKKQFINFLPDEVFEKFTLRDWFGLLSQTQSADHKAKELGIWDKLGGGSIIVKLLLLFPSRAKLCNLRKLNNYQWTALMLGNEEFLKLFPQKIGADFFTNTQLNDLVKKYPRYVRENYFFLEWDNLDSVTTAALVADLSLMEKVFHTTGAPLEEIYEGEIRYGK